MRRLRKEGKRRGEHDLARDVGVSGELSSYISGRYQVLVLFERNDQRRANLIPPLYDPQLESVQGPYILMRGFERETEGSSTFMQEWSIQVIRQP